MMDRNPNDWDLKLDDARAAAERLALISNELNDTLRRAEAALTALNLGVEVDVFLEEGARLHFSKYKGRWALVIVDESDCYPALSASRRVRIRVAKALPFLISALPVKVVDYEQSVREALATAREAIERIEGR